MNVISVAPIHVYRSGGAEWLTARLMNQLYGKIVGGIIVQLGLIDRAVRLRLISRATAGGLIIFSTGDGG